MKGVMRTGRRASKLLAGVVLRALIAVPAVAAPRAGVAPFPVIDAVEPLPGTAAAKRLEWQRKERALHGMRQRPLTDPAAAGAANFSALAGAAWRFDHQDITAEILPASQAVELQIAATVLVNDAADTEAVKNIEFFIAEVDEKTLQVLGEDGQPVPYELDQLGYGYSAIKLLLPAPVAAGGKIAFVFKATVPLDCNGDSSLGLQSCAFSSELNYVAFTRYYLSSYEAQHSVSRTTLHVLTGKNEVAAAPGLPSGPDPAPDGKLVWHFEQKDATDNAGFAVGTFKPFAKNSSVAGQVRVFTRGSYVSNADNVANVADDILGYYSQTFVPFPWQSGLNLIQLDGDFGGGYAPLGAAFMLRSAFGIDEQSDASSLELIAHEIGHQWWGNLVSPMGGADVALSESMAEYSSCLYTEQKRGSRGQILGNTVSYLYTVPANTDTGVGSANVYGSPNYFQIVYHKGSVVMDMLRRELGEQVFHDALTKLATDFGRDYAKIADLKAACESVSGRDLDWFFEQWFVRKGAIRAQISGRIERADGKTEVRLRIQQDTGAKPFRFQLPIRVDCANGQTEEFVQDVIPDASGQTMLVLPITKGPPVRIRVDPLRQVLRYFAVGTPGDVNLTGEVDGADLVDQALRDGRAIRTVWGNQQRFTGDYGYNELSDLNADFRVDADDADELLKWVGVVAETF